MTRFRTKSFIKLKLFLQAMGIKFRFKHLSDSDEPGVYDPHRNIIYIDSRLSYEKALSISLHESGHLLDERVISTKEIKRLDKAYAAFHKEQTTSSQDDLIYLAEKKAWMYGIAIANLLKIQLPKKFYKVKKECLDTYKD